MSSQERPESIPVISIGVTRATALQTTHIFENTPYTLVAVLDLTETLSTYQYNPRNLGAILFALHPRPRVLISGTAVAGIVEDVQLIWDEYVKEVEGELGDGRAVYVPLSEFKSQDGPPPEGTVEYLMEKLDSVFRPELVSK